MLVVGVGLRLRLRLWVVLMLLGRSGGHDGGSDSCVSDGCGVWLRGKVGTVLLWRMLRFNVLLDRGVGCLDLMVGVLVYRGCKRR